MKTASVGIFVLGISLCSLLAAPCCAQEPLRTGGSASIIYPSSLPYTYALSDARSMAGNGPELVAAIGLRPVALDATGTVFESSPITIAAIGLRIWFQRSVTQRLALANGAGAIVRAVYPQRIEVYDAGTGRQLGFAVIAVKPSQPGQETEQYAHRGRAMVNLTQFAGHTVVLRLRTIPVIDPNPATPNATNTQGSTDLH